MVYYLTYRRNNCSCSTKTTLCKILNLIKVYWTLLNLKS